MTIQIFRNSQGISARNLLAQYNFYAHIHTISIHSSLAILYYIILFVGHVPELFYENTSV